MPAVAALLLLVLNHAGVMRNGGPQSLASNALMLPCVAIALCLASVELLSQTLGRAAGMHTAVAAALPVTAVATITLSVAAGIARTRGCDQAGGGRGADSSTRTMVRARPVEVTLGALVEHSAVQGLG